MYRVGGSRETNATVYDYKYLHFNKNKMLSYRRETALQDAL